MRTLETEVLLQEVRVGATNQSGGNRLTTREKKTWRRFYDLLKDAGEERIIGTFYEA